jgi:glycosyltransferase involved in cell wall biosynthesis/ubiquinone/menaquinone biosynthesis C-methylase UbiE
MDFTGERFVPQIHGNIELEHMHRYLMACDLAAGKDVLDIACGEGYGSARLARSARQVCGVDISNEAVVHAGANYAADNIRFLVGSCEAIPLPDRSVDLVVSFETIEHHDKHDEMMLEIKRVLRPNGVVIISSPDKQTYSVEPNYQNPYHVKELFAGEFKELLSNHFRNTKHFGQKITYGSAILEEEGSSPQKSYWDENNQIHSNGGSYKPVYILSIASDSELPMVYSGIYDRPESECGYASYLGSVIVERDSQIEELHHIVGERDRWLAERAEEIANLNAIVQSAKAWQKRSWFKRSFHRWRPPNDKRVNLKNKLRKKVRKFGKSFLSSTTATDIQPGENPVQKDAVIVAPSDFTFVPLLVGAEFISPPVKAICFYLPQFHPIPENNEWWGEGFTEWTNVRPAKPQFKGHYQPHVPGELGYYNLLDEGVQERQVELAKLYGIGGFCFYFYWFHGHRLLEDPILRYLANPHLDLPFCLCWANENWSRRWDGSEQEILIAQDHTPQDDLAFIQYISIYLKDSRYIRVGGRPLLLLYRPSLLPNISETVVRWRNWCRENGIGEIYLAYTQSFDRNNPNDFGFDAAVEFPPNNTCPREVRRDGVAFDEAFNGKTYDICSLSGQSGNYSKPDYKLFRSACPSWDNTARKKGRGTIFCNGSPAIYLNWLKNAVRETIETFPEPDERLVFINAWNEWAEGAHLEPDQSYGYAWLDATRRALMGRQGLGYKSDIHVLVIGHDAHLAGAQIVLLSLLREWSRTREFSFQIILGADGVLRDQYEVLEETLVLSDFEAGESRDKQLKQVASQKIDIVLSSTVTNGPLLKSLRSHGLLAPVVTYSHELQKSIERWAGDGIMEHTLGHSGRFIAGGTEVGKNLITAHNVAENRLDVVHGFVDIWDETRIPDASAQEKLARELGIQVGDFVVFGCGTTDWRKGPDLFLSIAELCCSKSSNMKFVWIGGDSEEYSALAAKTGLSKQIRFLPNALESRRYYYIGHLFLLSSREDPFPLVSLEAADAGLPIICFENSGGMPRFVGDDAGIAVPFEDVIAAADAILALASDNDKRRSLGSTGQERVRTRHSTPIAASQVAEILRETCGRNRKIEPKAEIPFHGPLVSVIVPNYNHEKYLPQRLASIANQTFRDIEIILLDDASTDDSLSVLKDFASREPRARLIPNVSNSGSTFKQWRKGFREAKGRYIWIAESDDSAELELLTRLVEALESDPSISLACCQLRMMDPQGKMGGTPDDWLGELDPHRWKSSFISDGREEIRRYLSRKNTILNASGVVFRKYEDLESLADESMRLCGDWLFWSRLLSRGKIAYHAEPLNHWRLQTSNARTRPDGELEWEEGQRVIAEIAEILNASPVDKAEMLTSYGQKCDEWRAKS